MLSRGQNKYLYGIISEPHLPQFNVLGVGEAEVYAIPYQKLAAVVSDIDQKEIDPIRKNVLAHTRIQDEIIKKYDLLPMGFGMIAGSDEEILKLLEQNYQPLSDEFLRLVGKVEIEIKLFWNQEAMLKVLESENQEFMKLKTMISRASSPVKAQNFLVEAGKLIERVADEWKAKYAEETRAHLQELAVDILLNDPTGVKNILNASFLIERSREKEFQDKVHELDLTYQDKVNFKYIGPLPPYNFIQVRLEL